MSSDNEQTMYLPPPRIAARFNRASNRKSAGSSRRNSVSSLHSNRSNRATHGGVQSAHIAQHLRRASIIESRKARLADKAAHAEKVRLRAKQAKAAPKTARSSEDRALAAQQARAAYLAQVTASCAEEVRRAKRIAEENKERKAQEELKLRGDMEEKLADAERRRLLYQQNIRRPRTHNLPVVEEKKVKLATWKPKNEEAAARVIQKAWRNKQIRKTISGFLQLAIQVSRVQETSFEDISVYLSQDNVLTNTEQLISLCGLNNSEGARISARIFLSAFLILGHPKQVLSNIGEQEEDLIEKAKIFLVQLERVLSKPPIIQTFQETSDLMISLSEAYTAYESAFHAWKNHDSSFMVDTMIAQFVELDAILQTVKNDTAGNVAEDYRESIQQNQAMILVRLKRLIGPDKALKTIRDAVRARRKTKMKRKPVGDGKPRSTTTAAAPAPVPRTSISSASSAIPESETMGLGSHTQALNEVIRPLPDNRTVVHELSIDKEYRIDAEPISEMRRTVNRVVFDTMRNDIALGKGDPWILAMAEMIREKLLRVVTPGKSLHELISEGLDSTLIQNQLRIGAFSYEKFFSFMNTILPKLCAPVRDPVVQALAADTNSDLVERLAHLMQIVDLLSLDYANYILQRSSPELIRHASDYEQKCFGDEYQNKRLIRTLRWWKLARPRSTSTSTSTPSSKKIYTTGLVNLFIAPSPLQVDELPETLALDETRISRIRGDILHIITISSILLTAKNLLKRDVRTQWKALAQRMWDMPIETAYTSASPYLSFIESVHALPPATKVSLQGTIERVLSDARSSPEITHPVMKVLLQKIRAHAMTRLNAGSEMEKAKSAASATEVLGAGGLVEFVGRIGKMVEEMAKVRQVDWDAHSKWLDEVAKESTATTDA